MNTDDNDRELAAAWRAASRDEPPAALDDALRAAARRAVGAGPSRTKHMRTWPLAAAAVMAVFAIGLLQLTPPEQVSPGMDADSSSPRQKLQDAAKPAGSAAPVIAEPAKNDAPVTIAANSGAADAGSTKRDASVGVPTSPAATGAAPPTVRAPVATTAKRTPTEAEAPQRSAVAEAPAGERFAALARKELAQAPAPESAAKPQAPSAARLRDQTRGDAANATAETVRELDKKSKQEAGAVQEEAQAAAKARAEPFPATAAQDKVAAAAVPAAPPPAVATAPAPAAAPAPPPAAQAMTNRPAPAPAEMAGALSAQRSAGSAATPEKLAKDAAPRPAEEWIKLIRKLQSEGRSDEAVKELKEFRAAYKERADALLPADLRAIKP